MATTKGRVGLHRDRWHRYAWGSSDWQPGVTSILRVQDAVQGPDRLINWNVNTAIGAMEQGATPEEAVAATNAARDRGSRVHAGWDAAIKDEAHLPLPEDGKLYYHLMRWVLRKKPEIIATEQMVINLTAGFGGTFDLDCIIDGKRSLVDLKTGKPKPEHALQLAAYAAGEWIGEADDPTKYPLPEFEAFYVLALSDDGYELIPLTVGEAELKHFLFLAETYHKLKSWAKESGS